MKESTQKHYFPIKPKRTPPVPKTNIPIWHCLEPFDLALWLIKAVFPLELLLLLLELKCPHWKRLPAFCSPLSTTKPISSYKSWGRLSPICRSPNVPHRLSTLENIFGLFWFDGIYIYVFAKPDGPFFFFLFYCCLELCTTLVSQLLICALIFPRGDQ